NASRLNSRLLVSLCWWWRLSLWCVSCKPGVKTLLQQDIEDLTALQVIKTPTFFATAAACPVSGRISWLRWWPRKSRRRRNETDDTDATPRCKDRWNCAGKRAINFSSSKMRPRPLLGQRVLRIAQRADLE